MGLPCVLFVCCLVWMVCGQGSESRNVGLGRTPASRGGEGQTSEMPIKPRARRLPDVRGLVTRITQARPLPLGLHLTEGLGCGD